MIWQGLVRCARRDWRSSTYLNDFITRKQEKRNVRRVTGHEITIQHSQDTFVGDDEKVVLFSFEFKDNGLEAHGDVVIGL